MASQLEFEMVKPQSVTHQIWPLAIRTRKVRTAKAEIGSTGALCTSA